LIELRLVHEQEASEKKERRLSQVNDEKKWKEELKRLEKEERRREMILREEERKRHREVSTGHYLLETDNENKAAESQHVSCKQIEERQRAERRRELETRLNEIMEERVDRQKRQLEEKKKMKKLSERELQEARRLKMLDEEEARKQVEKERDERMIR